jgi:FkbM family methyltransferase
MLAVDERRRMGFMLLRDERVTASFVASGFEWTMPVGDEISRELFATGSYDGDAVEALTERYPSGRLLEIGANVGTATLPFARAGWDVIAIEPVPELFHHLTRNVECNGFSDRVVCVNAAVAATNGEAEMVLPQGMHGSSHLDGFGHFDARGATRVRVPTVTLQSLLEQHGEPSLIWCDAEGIESVVIEAGSALWARGVPLYVELMSEALPAAVEHFDKFALKGMGTFAPISDLAVDDDAVDVLLAN